MVLLSVKHLFQRGGRWWTNFAHPMLRRPNGKAPLIRITTGLELHQVESAQAWSDAIQQFKADAKWHNAVMYGQARKIHEGAAKAFYTPLKGKIDVASAVNRTYVNWPEIEDDGYFREEALTIEEGLQRARIIEGENNTLKIEAAEKDALIATLNKELGKTLNGKDYKLADVVPGYIEWGTQNGGKTGRKWCPEHAKKIGEYLTYWQKKFHTLGEIKVIEVEKHQRDLQTTRTGKTVANYTGALNSLLEYCVGRKLMLTNPLRGACKVDSRDRQERRILTPEEIQALLTNCSDDHRLVYQTALCTGLRANELSSLVVADLDVERQGVVLHREWTKNRKPGFQPIPAWLVDELRAFAANRLPTARLLPRLPKGANTAKSFKADCRRAGINPDDNGSGVLVFHSLRATFLTMADGAGASPKSTQALARHATPILTFDRYVKAVPAELVRVVGEIGRVVKGA